MRGKRYWGRGVRVQWWQIRQPFQKSTLYLSLFSRVSFILLELKFILLREQGARGGTVG